MLSLLEQCVRIRAVELEIARRYSAGLMRQPVHLSIGQEACAVGVCAALPPEALMVGSHRSHAWYLAKGGSLNALIAELHGKQSGCSRGHGGSMHLSDLDCGFIGSTSIVAGTIPIGVGMAWGNRLRDISVPVVTTFGDGACEQGVLHESMNFAALHKLPVLFVCEDNRLSCQTPIELRQPARPIARIAEAHGIYGTTIDDRDVENIKWITEYCLKRLPALLVISTKRFYEHCGPACEIAPNDVISTFKPSPEMLEEIDLAFFRAANAPNAESVSMYAD